VLCVVSRLLVFSSSLSAWFETQSIHHLSKDAWLNSPHCAKVLEERVWAQCEEEATKQAAVQRRRDARKLAAAAQYAQDRAAEAAETAADQAAQRAAALARHAELLEQDKIAHDAFEAKMRAIREKNEAEALAAMPPPPPEKTAEEIALEAREMMEYEWGQACRRAREQGLPEPQRPDELLSPAQLEERREEEAQAALRAAGTVVQNGVSAGAAYMAPQPPVLIIQPPPPRAESGCCCVM